MTLRQRNKTKNEDLTLVMRFYFYAHMVRLGVKKCPQRLLRRTSTLFLFNCEPGRIEQGRLKDSNFKTTDNRKWALKQEILKL